MKFMMMVHHKESELAKIPPAEIERVVGAHGDYTKALEKAGLMVSEGFRLRPGVEMVRVTQSGGQNGRRAVMDGPHAETREVVGGFYVIECKSREEAIAWAKRCPMWDSDTLELRPVWEM
jgi:hypothetical protein